MQRLVRRNGNAVWVGVRDLVLAVMVWAQDRLTGWMSDLCREAGIWMARVGCRIAANSNAQQTETAHSQGKQRHN